MQQAAWRLHEPHSKCAVLIKVILQALNKPTDGQNKAAPTQ